MQKVLRVGPWIVNLEVRVKKHDNGVRHFGIGVTWGRRTVQ